MALPTIGLTGTTGVISMGLRLGRGTGGASIATAVWMVAGWPSIAAADVAGRWTGEMRVGGEAMPIVVDLALDGSRAWHGSVVLPGRGVKGAPIAELKVEADAWRGKLGAAFSGAPGLPAPEIEARLQADGSLAGTFRQGGHSTALKLVRGGAAQVDKPVAATAVSPQLEGTWQGRYELGGYAREVTMTLANRPGSTAQGQLVIVGKRRSELTIDRVVQTPGYLVLEAGASGIRIEGRWRATDSGAEIDGEFTQGPFEARLPLKRSGTRP